MIIQQQKKKNRTKRNEWWEKMEQIRMSRLWFGASLQCCWALVWCNKCLCGVKNYRDVYWICNFVCIYRKDEITFGKGKSGWISINFYARFKARRTWFTDFLPMAFVFCVWEDQLKRSSIFSIWTSTNDTSSYPIKRYKTT